MNVNIFRRLLNKLAPRDPCMKIATMSGLFESFRYVTRLFAPDAAEAVDDFDHESVDWTIAAFDCARLLSKRGLQGSTLRKASENSERAFVFGSLFVSKGGGGGGYDCAPWKQSTSGSR